MSAFIEWINYNYRVYLNTRQQYRTQTLRKIQIEFFGAKILVFPLKISIQTAARLHTSRFV